MLNIIQLKEREYVKYFIREEIREGMIDDLEKCMIKLKKKRERVRKK